MEDNPNPNPNPNPAPDSAPEPAPQLEAEPTPQPEAEPASQPESQPEPQPEAPAEPASEPAPEAEPAPEPTPAPEADAPAEEHVASAEPVMGAANAAQEPAPVNPFNPAAPAPDAAIPAPKKKISGGIIGLIIGLAVLLIGGGIFAFLYFTSRAPEKIVSSAFANLMNKDSFGVTLNMETSNGDQSYKITSESYFDNAGTTYMRIDGMKNMLGGLTSGAADDPTGLATAMSMYFSTIFEKIEGTWWKIPAGTDSSSLTDIAGDEPGLGIIGGSMDQRAKRLAAFKKYPFLTATPANDGKKYATSGTVYNVSINYDQLLEFEREAGLLENERYEEIKENMNDEFGSYYRESLSQYASFVATVNVSLFGDANVTGLYMEKTEDEATTKLSFDFEHAATSAPADAKDVSELQKEFEGLFSASTGTDDEYDIDDTTVEDDTLDIDFEFDITDDDLLELEDTTE